MFENKRMKWIVGLLVLAMLVPLAGCSKSIVGKWADKDAMIEFKSDGTGTLGDKDAIISMPFTWKTDGGKLTISMEIVGSKDETMGEYSVSESTLTLKDPSGSGETKTFTRVK